MKHVFYPYSDVSCETLYCMDFLFAKSTYIIGFRLSVFYLYIIINNETIYSVKQSNVSCETLKNKNFILMLSH